MGLMVKHGITQYRKGCRCSECVDAKRAEYAREPRKTDRKKGVLSHGTSKMYKTGCRCEDCVMYNRSAQADRYTHKPRTNGRKSASEKYDFTFAKQLLEDGASYRETALSTGIPKSTLIDNLPGYGWTAREGRMFARELARHSEVSKEVWDQNRRNDG